MQPKADLPANKPPSARRYFGWPSTRLGGWSVGAGALFGVLWIINTVVFMPSTVEAPWRQVLLPFYGIFMIVCGLTAGITGLIAVLWRRERSRLVWLTGISHLDAPAFRRGEERRAARSAETGCLIGTIL